MFIRTNKKNNKLADEKSTIRNFFVYTEMFPMSSSSSFSEAKLDK